MQSNNNQPTDDLEEMAKQAGEYFKKPDVLHIIVDGSDKTGKSTVCAKLSELLGMPLIKMQDMPKHFKNGQEEVASEIFNKAIVQFVHTAFIMDRGYPSSMVYSRYFMRSYDLSYIKEIVRKLDARIFILDVAPRKVDDIINYHQQEEIRNLYLQYAKKHGWTVIPCTGQTPDQICATIIKELNSKK